MANASLSMRYRRRRRSVTLLERVLGSRVGGGFLGSPSPQPFGALIRMGGVDVGQRGVGGDAEHPHEVDWIDGGAGFVEDAIASQPGEVDAQRLEYLP